MLARYHVFFRGRVQGVGFRYTATKLARPFALRGWVKNLRDGRVELLAQGARAEIEQFLERLDDRLGANIEEREEVWSAPAEDPGPFAITS